MPIGVERVEFFMLYPLQVTSTPSEARVSTPPISRTRDDAEKVSARRNQGGTRSKPSETR